MKTKKRHKSSYQKRFNMGARLISSVAIAAVVLLTSCGSTDTGHPNSEIPRPSSSSTAEVNTSSTAKYGAPPVPNPLDVQTIVENPCSALTKKQINKFPGTLEKSFKSETTRFSDKKTSCAWKFEGDRYSLGTIGGGVPLPHDRYHGISSIYKARGQNAYEVFRPVEIAGYPAVINNQTDSTDGSCRLSVGLRNDTAYRITASPSSQSPDYDRPCEQAKKLASFVVQNLKEAQ